MNYENIELVNNESIHNFELMVDGYRAFIDYQKKGDKVFLIHTEVAPELKGKGVAEVIVDKTLTYIDQHNLKLVPLCVYVGIYLKRHPEWSHLLA
ncbi:GNAT family N-acetyltransferase [Mucilaginibacter terrae]|uniref:GNAT family N-acetyltransferase n=1 Tax=Mucilaginibacter terrae TaxID=1955052 RepID=UPI0036442EC5